MIVIFQEIHTNNMKQSHKYKFSLYIHKLDKWKDKLEKLI